MHNWNFTPERPISLTLATDARLNLIDHHNDQIWALRLGNADAPMIALETTFGLRARLCRIFPSFRLEDRYVTDPAEFSNSITIRRYFPNFIELTFKPFSHINVKLEYWVPSSQVIAGRATIHNSHHNECSLEMDWSEILLPSSDGTRMAINEVDLISILTGRSSNLSPVLFLIGGAQAGKSAYPSLNLVLAIPPNGEKSSYWAHASLGDMNASFLLAKNVFTKKWDAEIAQIARINSKNIDIQTGDKDWDTAFSLSQNIASQLFLRPAESNTKSFWVSQRHIDQGYSLSENGTDSEHRWDLLSPLDSHYLMNFILPASPELLSSILDNYFDTQNSNGEIDWKPGLSGQRSHILPTPIFTEMAFRLYETSGNIDYLKTLFPQLLVNFFSWFTLEHDQDEDQFPEWEHPIQTGHTSLPEFSTQHPWALGADISTIESPDLASYLYRDCARLIQIANLVDDIATIDRLQLYANKLKEMVENTWSDHDASYHYRDRDTHIISQGELISTHQGNGIFDLHTEFIKPARPIVQVELVGKNEHSCQIYIHGTIASGAHRVETIKPNQFHWQQQLGYATSLFSYALIERIEIDGIQSNDTITLYSISLNALDISLALPLWAGIPSKERAKILVNLSLMNKKKFLSPNGIRTYVADPEIGHKPIELSGIHFPSNALILDGLVQYGERKKAGEIFQRLMKPIIKSFRQGITLYQSYDSETGKPIGPQNSLASLLPLGLFLKILGITIFTPYNIELDGFNPFPWPVTIKFQGLTIIKHEKKTLVIFPDGHTITVNNDQRQTITRGKNNQLVLS